MKRIIMFVLLLAALKVAGQTTGYLRYDTVRIMKQNGTCELYIINKTKDSLGLLTNVGGGLTRFIKPKMLNDSSIIIGLDTLLIRGGGGGRTDSFGIQDNVSNVDRYIDMQDHVFMVDNSSEIHLMGTATGYTSRLQLANVASLRSTDGVREQFFNVYPHYAIINTNASNVPGKLVIQSSDSLHPSDANFKVMVMDHDTVKVVPRDSVGGGGGGEANTASNVGSGAGLFKTKSGVDLQFKSVTSDPTITVTGNTNDVNVKADTGYLKGVYLPLTLPSAKIINQAGHDIRFGGGGQVIGDSLRLEQTHNNPTKGLDSAVGGGNSIMNGLNATVRPDSTFFGRSCASVGVPGTNLGVSSTIIYQICSSSLNYINPGHNALQIMEGGLNNLRNNAANVNMYRGIGNGFEAAFVNHFLASYTAASNCTVTGSWTTNYDAKANAGGKTTQAAYSTSAGADITKSVTGTAVAVGLIGQYSSARAAEIYIDGVLQETVATDNQTFAAGTGYQAMARYYTGLSAGSHTVKVVVGSGSGFLMVDYIGVLEANMKPFVIVHIPHMASAEYPNGNATEAIIDHANDTLTARYTRARAAGLNVFLAQTNVYYTTDGISGDNIHPNDLGHYQISQAILNGLDPSRSLPGTIKYGSDGRMYIADLDGVMRKIAVQSDVTFQSALTAGSTLTAPNTITGLNTIDWLSFPRFRVNDFHILPTSTVMHGVLATQGPNSTLAFLSRDGDTTKGFLWYSSNHQAHLYSTLTDNTLINTDTSYRTAFINNITDNTFGDPDATVNIGGNTLGIAGHTPLKIKFGKPVSTPEAGAIEPINRYWWRVTDSLGKTDTIATRLWFRDSLGLGSGGITSINSQTGSSQTIAGAEGNTVTASSNTITIHSPYTLVYSDTSTTTVGNTTSQTSLIGNIIGSTSFAGSSITPGTKIVQRGYGSISTKGAPVGNMELSFTISNYTFGINNALPASLGNAPFEYEYELTPFGTGTNQDVFYKAKITVYNTATGAIAYTNSFNGKSIMTTTGTISADVKAQWVTADTDNTITSRGNTMEVIRLQ